MNINKIQNSTLAKLTAKEIGALGLVNYGVGLYRGELKSRKKGLTTIRVSDNEIHFEGTVGRLEFIKIVQAGEVTEWAARLWTKPTYPGGEGHYETYPLGIMGCDFFRC